MPDDPGEAIPSELRVLLIQVRDAPEVAEHERASVQQVTGLDAAQIETLNLVNEPASWTSVERNDAVIIGGAGVHSAVNDDPFREDLETLIRRMIDERVPLFGSCYGHQFIARALGGSVIHDMSRAEVGAIEVTATDAAPDDPVFGPCPRTYTVLMGHQDRVDRLPDGAVELAFSATCRNQAFRIDGAPAWGSQFHSELTPERLLDRLRRYPQYTPEPGGFESIVRALRPTPEAREILRRFLSMVAPGGGWRGDG